MLGEVFASKTIFIKLFIETNLKHHEIQQLLHSSVNIKTLCNKNRHNLTVQKRSTEYRIPNRHYTCVGENDSTVKTGLRNVKKRLRIVIINKENTIDTAGHKND